MVSSTVTEVDNSYRYTGYEYLDRVKLYDLNARYYDPYTARFLSEDPYYNLGNRIIGLYEINTPNVISIMQANNLFAYCGNNPHIYIDSTGQAWYHWVIGAAVVAVAAVAVVATAGGAAAAVTAVTLVANGTAAATTASTVAAGAFIGSSVAYGVSVVSAASQSSSVEEFAEHGDWGTVAYTATGALYGGYGAYSVSPKIEKIKSENVTFNQSSVDKAFSKHKTAFGNYGGGSKSDVNSFIQDLKKFIDSGKQMGGTYHSFEGTHIYNSDTRQWVFINSDGSFNTGFVLSEAQYNYMMETGVVK